MYTFFTALALVAALAAGDEKAAFDKLDKELTALERELASLKQKYESSTGAAKDKIASEFEAKVKQRNETLPRLFAAAEKAYLAEPNKDDKVAKVMPQIVGAAIEEDRNAEALRVAKLLLDKKHPEKQLYELAGVAAFNTDRFDEAADYFVKAKESGPMSQLGQKLAGVVEREREAWKKEKAIRAAEAKADDLPRVKFETTAGSVVIELFENEAPNTVANFIHLVEKGYYNGLTFHRVIGGFMAQGGDPTGKGSGGPGWAIKCECYREDYRRHFSGTLSMAHAGRDTGGSQFFLTFVPTPHLDGKHTAFGRVIEGAENLPKITRRDPDEETEPSKIVKATVVRKRDHKYEPEKLPSSR